MTTSTVIDRDRSHADEAAADPAPRGETSRRPGDTAAPDLSPDGIAPIRGLTTRQVAWRLFLTCWIVYSLHFATNIVREIFPALALGDHFSFRVDDYANMHPDLFETPGRGWHIGNNPGASMLAAIPYTIARPVIDPLVERVRAERQASGQTEPPAYKSDWPMARWFYTESWRRGYDIKFALGAFVMHAFCMAPSSAAGVLAVFLLMRLVFRADATALFLALLYAVGTPVFFRTGFLNHNLMLGHFAFMGFLAIWNPTADRRWSTPLRFFLGGLAGGTAILFDYSGVVLLLGLFAYGVLKRWTAHGFPDAFRHGSWYVLGTLPPVLLLWFYQWRAFGHPFYPGQHWMPPVKWIDQGYQGYGAPQFELIWRIALDYRYGIFVTCPLFLLALVAPWVNARARYRLPAYELWSLIALFAALWIFFAGNNYTRLQFNTGIRYMAPIFPFLFVPAVIVLMRLPRAAIYFIAVASVALAWSTAMYRDVERGFGVFDPVVQTFLGGFTLPALRTLGRMDAYRRYFEDGVSPLPLFLLTAALIYGVWTTGVRRHNHESQDSSPPAPAAA